MSISQSHGAVMCSLGLMLTEVLGQRDVFVVELLTLGSKEVSLFGTQSTEESPTQHLSSWPRVGDMHCLFARSAKRTELPPMLASHRA